MKQIVCFLFALLSSTLVFSQEESYTHIPQTKLSSENMKVWDRKNSECTVKLYTTITELDTIHTLCFSIKDRKGVGNIAKGEQLVVKFEEGNEVVLNCDNDYDVTLGEKSVSLQYGFLVFQNSIQCEEVCPQYKISQKDLLNIVGGNITSLTFFMEGEPYPIHVRSNKFALAVGETCASLKSKNQNNTMPKITSKSIFGDTKLRRNTFGWNNTMSLSTGMGHMYSRLGGSNFSRRMPINMILLDITLKGLYMGCSVGRHTDNDYIQQILTFKAGPVFRYGNIRNRITFTPYIGILQGESSSKRDKGKTLESKTYFIGGMRTAVEIKKIQIAANFSNKECGIALGVVF